MNTETMVERPTTAAEEMGALQKIIGVFTSPTKTFQSLDRNPSWLLPIIIYMVVNLGFIFLAKDIIIQEELTRQENKMLEQGMDSEQMDQRLAIIEKSMQYTVPIFGLVFSGLFVLIVAGVFMFVGNVVLGGTSTFKKIFAITAYSFLILCVGALVTLPLVLARQSMQVSFSLAALMSDEARKTFLYQLLSKVDIFWIWWLAVYSIGLAVIYKMKTQKMAMAVAAVYLIYAVAAAALTALFS
jgi:hypothetical protein